MLFSSFLALAFMFWLPMEPMHTASAADFRLAAARSSVTEGDFAVQLTEALNLGKSDNPEEAEGLLVGSGIEPRNGWITDRPMTRPIVIEIERSVVEAIDSGQLDMGKKEAIETVEGVAANFHFPVIS